MEMVERINFEEIIDDDKEDRISGLLDCLIVEILSRLPSTKEAIRTGTLSKRWLHLWNYVPTLIFEHDMEKHSRSDFFSFVDKTLTQCRQLKLKKFKLDTSWDSQVESQVNSWIRCAINCNVEHLNLNLWNFECEAKFLLPQFIMINSCLTDLTLTGCIFNPTSAISWKNLKSLYISNGKLDEDLIENILSGSPVLETLNLDYCYGYRRLDINSKSVKNLLFSGYSVDKLTFCGYSVPNDLSDDHIIEINAPTILSLTIQYDLLLRKLLLLNVSSLVKADLDYSKGGHFETTPEDAEEEILKGVILSLRHVKEVKIGFFCFKVLSRLEAKGFIFPLNLKVPDVPLPSYSDNDEICDWSDSDLTESEDFEELLL